MRFRWTNHAILSAGLLTVLGAGVARPLSQTVQQDALLHVDLLVQHPDGEPVGYLTAKDFVVMEGGQRLPVQVVLPQSGAKVGKQPTVPTRMLVIVDSPTASSPDGFSRVVAALGPVWQRGWQVAVARIDGNASSYAASADELLHNWATLADSSIKTEAGVQALVSFLGRRVVLLVGDAGQDQVKVPNWLRSKAQDALADLVVVDNGKSSRRTGDGDTLAGLARASDHGGGGYMPDAMGVDKLSLHSAVRKAMHGSLGYYDLRVPLRGGTGLDAALSVRIRRDEDLNVLSQVFSEGLPVDLKVTTEAK